MSHAARCFAVVAPPRWGKTRAVRALASRVHAAGVSLTGIVQPATVSGDRVVRYDVMRLPEGDSRRLAKRRPDGRGYRFDPDAFAWAETVLARPSALLVLDEIGLMEARGEGHAPGLLHALSASTRRAVLLAVRQQTFESLAPRPGTPHPAGGLTFLFQDATRWTLDPDRATRTAQLDAWTLTLMEATR